MNGEIIRKEAIKKLNELRFERNKKIAKEKANTVLYEFIVKMGAGEIMDAYWELAASKNI